ncbi:hypothetical protein HO133_002963 [Letharia lupina]|uniref:ATP-grasp domain-containing protein n=1 Tax=Letharia lupina TaxID=560253 RepID=A0A8H6CBJ0_9LECA|nr:uncharacterized protein HO133_002963 [Letharia lupina]KAF6220530.1 hypothetical protein HO133_002963 [Letharia lupina]
MFRSVNIILDARLQYDKSQADISVSNASKASLDHLTCFQDDRGCNGDSSFAAINFFLFWCSVAAETPEGREAAVKLIVPRADGYLSKSDFLEQRLIEWEGVEKVQSFCQPRQYLRSQSAEQVQWDGLYQMLELQEAGRPSLQLLTGVNAVSVEPYCDGPEIDANFVLQDGEVLFVEGADDFPKAGDREEAGTSTVFKASAVLYPSGLPAAELEMVQRSLHQTLLKFGFRSGVSHVEARVRDSSMQYGVSDGVLDLQTAASESLTEAPNSFLIEVNPRLPGLMVTRAVHSTYGISYAALHLLIAVGDAERTAALSQPFCAGPQYWRNVVFITLDKGGVLAADDVG